MGAPDRADSRSLTLVTGAAGALGGALARRLAGAGHGILLVDQEARAPELEALAAGLDDALALPCDAADAPRLAEALSGAESRLGPVTGAALAAGTYRGGRGLAELGASDDGGFEALLGANLRTTEASLRVLLAAMVPRGQGSIVVVGSRAARRPESSAGAAAYAATKSAVVALAQAAAAEALASGVRVNAVLPSTLDTPANRAAMPSADPGRWVSLDSLAGVVAFLLSDEARDVTGAALPVYGRA